MITRRALPLIATPAFLATPALAQSARPIRMIIPFPPGGATDALSRMAANKLQEKLGVTVVADNRAGGNGVVGTMALLQAPNDGLTIMGSASIHVMLHRVLRSLPFDPVTDLTPIARTARGPLLFVIHPRRQERSVTEVIEAARRNPQDWSMTTSSLGAAGHLAAIAFNQAAGTDILIVPQRSSAAGLIDVAAGNVGLMFDPVLAPLPMVQGGQLRALAITNETRIAAVPDVPTMAEAGLRNFVFHSWYGVWGPRGMPVETVTRMNAALNEGFAEPDITARLSQLAFQAVAESAADFGRYIEADVARNTALLRSVSFQPEG